MREIDYLIKDNQDKQEDLVKLVKNQKYVIIIAPTGHGKTLIAEDIAKKIIEEDDNNKYIKKFIFKEKYDYTDFVKGLKFNKGSLKDVDKEFLSFVKESNVLANQGKKFVAILDDISRTDISEVMGDAMNALEPDGKEHRWNSADTKFNANFYIIGTCNPQLNDFKLDYAWMRRFSICKLNQVLDYNKQLDIDYAQRPPKYFDRFREELRIRFQILFDWYYIGDINLKDNYKIGKGFFLLDENQENLGDTEKVNALGLKLAYTLIPLMHQYIYDGILYKDADLDLLALEYYCKNKDGRGFNVGKQTISSTGNPKSIQILQKDLYELKKVPDYIWYLSVLEPTKILHCNPNGLTGYINCLKYRSQEYKTGGKGKPVAFCSQEKYIEINGKEIYAVSRMSTNKKIDNDEKTIVYNNAKGGYSTAREILSSFYDAVAIFKERNKIINNNNMTVPNDEGKTADVIDAINDFKKEKNI